MIISLIRRSRLDFLDSIRKNLKYMIPFNMIPFKMKLRINTTPDPHNAKMPPHIALINSK